MLNKFSKKLRKWQREGFTFNFLHRIHVTYSVKPPDNISALAHNSRTRLDEFYSDPDFVRNYLAPARLEFYEKVATWLPEHGITYDTRNPSVKKRLF